jgi:hypothetical protein
MINLSNINSKLFYCYSTNLKRFLIEDNHIKYLSKGINDKTKRYFWLFERTDKLKKCLDIWGLRKSNQ